MKLEARKYLYDIQHAGGLILIHIYANVDDRLVWNVIKTDLPILIREVDTLLDGEAVG